MLLSRLPPEVLHNIFAFLVFSDLEILLDIGSIAQSTQDYLQRHYAFEYKATWLLKQHFEAALKEGQSSKSVSSTIANELLQLLCQAASTHERNEQSERFSTLLSALEQWIGQRVIYPHLTAGMECNYASLCLAIRQAYLEQPDIRAMHDPRYRRRNTRYPIAPFLPREFTHIWRLQCNNVTELLTWPTGGLPSLSAQRRRTIRLRFARFFGMLFQATSVYLEFSLDGTFDECVREALLSGDVESLLVMCLAAERPVDVDNMCMMVSLAEEQLWSYIDLMADLTESNPTPEQEARLRQSDQHQTTTPAAPSSSSSSSLPEWLLPSRYRIHESAPLRLKLLYYLVDQQDWKWFDE